MTNSLDITKKFREKIEKLKEHNDLYFNQDNPKISDSSYDKLKKELIELEKIWRELEEENLNE